MLTFVNTLKTIFVKYTPLNTTCTRYDMPNLKFSSRLVAQPRMDNGTALLLYCTFEYLVTQLLHTVDSLD